MAKLPKIDLTDEQITAISDDLFVHYKRLILPQSPPCIMPIRMEPRIIDDDQEYDDNGSPIWRGYHPLYPTGSKWFSCDFGGAGAVLKVRHHKLYVEIMDITVEQTAFQWVWSIKLVKHYREAQP